MTDAGSGTPAVVVFPAEIDMTSLPELYTGLAAALSSGAAVVIADLSATVFCDVAGVRRLLELHGEATARQVELRLVIQPSGPVRRLLDLIEPAQPLRISPSLPASLGAAGS
jgi:anti-anti-sigma regulatory factor